MAILFKRLEEGGKRERDFHTVDHCEGEQLFDMFVFLIILHVLVSLILVVIVLLQAGKGGGLASAFGGSGGTDAVFGGRGAATFLSKMTTVLGIVFFVTSLTLAVSSSKSPSAGTVPQGNTGYAEPQPFNPEAQLLIESMEPPPAAEEGEEGETEAEESM